MKKLMCFIIGIFMFLSIDIPTFATNIEENVSSLDIKTIKYKGEVYIRLSDLEKLTEFPKVTTTKGTKQDEVSDEPMTLRDFYTAIVPEINENIPGYTGKIHNIPIDNPDHHLLATAWSLGYIGMRKEDNGKFYWMTSLDDKIERSQAAITLAGIHNGMDRNALNKIMDDPKYDHVYDKYQRIYYYVIDEGLITDNKNQKNGPDNFLYLEDIHLDKLNR